MVPRTVLKILFPATLVFAIALAGGCPRRPSEQTKQQELFTAYADLSHLEGTHHPGLQAELSLLQAERATPRLLEVDSERAIPDSDAVDLGELLTETFNRSTVKLTWRRSEKLFDEAGFSWDPINLEHAFRLRRQYDEQRRRIRTALAKPGVYLHLRFTQGVGMSTEFVDAGLLYHRLELFYGAEQLTRGDLEGALDCIEPMLSFCELLGEKKHVISRLAAADARREAFALVQAIVMNEAAGHSELERIRHLLGDHLAHWPDDADAWIGDRAQALHMYEMIRDGHLLSLLTEEELVRHRQNRDLQTFVAAAMRSVDADQHFYLRTMRDIIENCRRPFYQRAAVFQALRRDLDDLKRTPEYPLIADRLLLQDIQQGQRRQAVDRARAEAWANALSMALEERSPAHEQNPATGEPYKIYFEDAKVIVTRIDPARPQQRIVVPLRRAERVSRGGALPPPH